MHINVLISLLNLLKFLMFINVLFGFISFVGDIGVHILVFSWQWDCCHFTYKGGIKSTPLHEIAKRIWIWVTNSAILSLQHIYLLY